MLIVGLERVLVVSPHADDEVVGCGGLLAALSSLPAAVHVLYAAVDGSEHYGREAPTTLEQRLAEIEAAAGLLGFSYEIAHSGSGLMERLDTLPRRDLVDLFEGTYNEHRPQLVLVPFPGDYDQDHQVVFATAFAAARPIGEGFGKWLPPHVLAYEGPQLGWAPAAPIRRAAFTDISRHLDTKLEALRCYATQLRPAPHIRSPEAITALAALRGKEIGVEYAEAYGVLRTVL